MTLMDWLPLLPWEGPPLPRFLGIFWPRVGGEQSLPLPTSTTRYITAVEEKTEKALVPQASYTNEESWEIEWSDEGFPTKVTVHRNAKRT